MPMLERVFRNPPSDKESISLVVEKQHTNKAAWFFSSDSVKTEKKQDFFYWLVTQRRVISVQSNLVIRNFLVTLKLFLNAKILMIDNCSLKMVP